ncbi:MAG: hypothetical protein ACJAY2_003504 [Pseudomonadales bacterium]
MDKVVENLVALFPEPKGESAPSNCTIIGEKSFIINIQRLIFDFLS